jgi:galactarate dehydratase
MRQIRARRIARLVREVEPERGAGRQRNRAVGERSDAQLRALHVGQHADRTPDALLDGADLLQPLAVLLVRAVAEIEPEHVDAGEKQRTDHGLARARRAERRDDLGIAVSAHSNAPGAGSTVAGTSVRGARSNLFLCRRTPRCYCDRPQYRQSNRVNTMKVETRIASLTQTPLTIRMDERDNVAIVANDGGLPVGTEFPSGPQAVRSRAARAQGRAG